MISYKPVVMDEESEHRRPDNKWPLVALIVLITLITIMGVLAWTISSSTVSR